jgi:xylan 1,4-beta-xylosidase
MVEYRTLYSTQSSTISQSVLWLQRLIKEFPTLKGTAFHINEWGMSSNYFRTVKDYPDLEYRNSEESALFLVKLVNSLYQIEDNYNFPTDLLSYWGFSWEADEDEFFVGKRELTTAGNIPKPIQTGFEMLAKLESQRIKVTQSKIEGNLGILATKSMDNDVACIAYNYEESENDLKANTALKLIVSGLEVGAKYSIIETAMDRENNNTYREWERIKRPSSSENVDLSSLKDAATLSPTIKYLLRTNKEGELYLKLNLKNHSMKFLKIVKI